MGLHMQKAASQAQFLSSNQQFDLWLELATPEAHAIGGDELFQVRVQNGQGSSQQCTTVCV